MLTVQAFEAVPQNVSSNSTLLSQVIAYHVLTNAYLPSGVQVNPNHTIARSALRGGIYNLPGNRTQPLVLTRASADNSSNVIIRLSNGTNITTAGAPVAAANLQVYVIPQVISLPPTLPALLGQVAPALAGVAQQAGVVDALSSAAQLTAFVPIDSAVGAVQSALGSLNSTQIQTILTGHIVNGTSLFSTGISNGANVTAAGGQTLTFMTNSTGAFVMSSNSTARIISTDHVVNNGVVHLIDQVLVNAMGNPGAAQSAFESNTAAAAASTSRAGPVTQTSQPAASGNPSGGASGAASSRSAAQLESYLPIKSSLLGAIVGVVGVAIGGAAVLF
jgi:uncharacterized surface protein with fasciclin (FAS1) repeats